MGFVSRRVMVSHGIARDRHKSAGCAMVSNCKGGMRWECNYLLPFSCLHAVPYLVPHCQAHAVSPLKGPCSFRLQPDTCLCLITPVLNCKFSSCLGCLEDSPCSCSRRGLSPSAELFLGKPLQAGGSMQAAVLLEISRPALSLPDVPAGHSSMTTAPSPLLPGCCRAQRAGQCWPGPGRARGRGRQSPVAAAGAGALGCSSRKLCARGAWVAQPGWLSKTTSESRSPWSQAALPSAASELVPRQQPRTWRLRLRLQRTGEVRSRATCQALYLIFLAIKTRVP